VNSDVTVSSAVSVGAIERFFRRPKGHLILILAVVAVFTGTGHGPTLLAPSLLAAVCTAGVVDAPLLRWRRGRWIFPDGALLTGMIVGMVLSRREAWYVAPTTAAIAVLSKYAARGKHANVFNPAALALVAACYLFNPGEDWWGAVPDGALGLIAMLVLGAYIANRVNRQPAVVWFLGSYFLLFTVTSFVGDPRTVVEIYRAPDVFMVLYFAFFMVSDPPTSPRRAGDQRVFGVIIATTSFAVFKLAGTVWFLLAGLLVANAWEAWRRSRPSAGILFTAGSAEKREKRGA
jgi:Na+-translocating ferredoxin:NAD+ oxidoreductase RnfD subunit